MHPSCCIYPTRFLQPTGHRRRVGGRQSRGLLRRRLIVERELARMHVELREEPGERTAEEEEFAMTGEEKLREVEARAREYGEKEGRTRDN